MEKFLGEDFLKYKKCSNVAKININHRIYPSTWLEFILNKTSIEVQPSIRIKSAKNQDKVIINKINHNLGTKLIFRIVPLRLLI